MSELRHITEQIVAFRDARDWRQFHSPKNLVMALASEVGELCDLFRWRTEEQSYATPPEQVVFEVADVGIFLLALCERLQIDLGSAILVKLAQSETHYPVDLAKGNATKYTGLGR